MLYLESLTGLASPMQLIHLSAHLSKMKSQVLKISFCSIRSQKFGNFVSFL